MHPDKRAFGSYGQYCSPECRDTKNAALWTLGSARFGASGIVLIVESEYVYLVLDRMVKEHSQGYNFKILQESCMYGDHTERHMDYCHYPGFGIEDHPVTYKIYPQMAVAIERYDVYAKSVWTMVGFSIAEDGTVNTFGVGGHIEVIDSRKEQSD
jgi:hypothetical protein